MTFKIIIAGGRDFNDYVAAMNAIDSATKGMHWLEIVSGGANGADSLGERWAHDRCFPVIRFPADWAKYGRSAGPRRNRSMAEYATHLIAFWDGASKGTKNMIKVAEQMGLKIKVINYDSAH